MVAVVMKEVRYVIKREDGVDNYSVIDARTGETVEPQVLCDVLNLFINLHGALDKLNAEDD